MRRLFKKRLLGIPVAVLLVLALTAGGVVVAYGVLSGTVTVTVEEALVVEYSWDEGTNWDTVTDGFTYAVTGAYPGECHEFMVRIQNNSSASLWVTVTHTLTSWPSGGHGKVSITGVSTDLFSAGISVPGNTTLTKTGLGCVAGDAPDGDYVFGVTVERGDGV